MRKNYKKNYIYLILLLLIISSELKSQTNTLPKKNDTLSKFTLAPILFGQLSNHSAGFTDFSGCKTCAAADNVKFNNSSSGLDFGFCLAGEYRLTKELTLQARAYYQTNKIDFSTDKAFLSYVQNNNTSPSISKVYNQHELKVNFNNIGLQLLSKTQVYDNINLLLGTELIFVLKREFAYKEVLFDESGTRYFDTKGALERNVQGPNFSDPRTTMYGIVPGISYEYKFDNKYSIEPELTYRFIVNNFVKEENVDWHYGSINFGIKFNITQSYEIESPCDGLEPCPEGTTRDINCNCVPIKKQEKAITPPVIANKISCPPGFVKDKTKDTCIYNFPTPPDEGKNCIGNYIAIQVKSTEQGEKLLKVLKEQKNINQFVLKTVADARDKKITVSQLESGCYDNSQSAVEAQRLIKSIIRNLVLDSNDIDKNSINPILMERK